MFLLYGLFTLMLIGAICLLTIPFAKQHAIFSWRFLAIIVFVILFSLGFYELSGDRHALQQWFAQGSQHYKLQEDVEHLGGFTGIIQQIKKKLAAHPDDAQGWFILGKLYLANKDFANAKSCLKKALKLQPNNTQIKHYYDLAISQ